MSNPNTINPSYRFSYPGHNLYPPFHPRQVERLGKYENVKPPKDERIFSNPSEDIGCPLTPAMALIMWADSIPGILQSRQDCRYPTEHRDLPIELTDLEAGDAIGLDSFRKKHLKLLVNEYRPHYKSFDQGIDFHPIGHMALTSLVLDQLIMFGPYNDQPMIHLARHSMALHDIGETQHPVHILEGGAIGDISAVVGKSEADRLREQEIFLDCIEAVFPETYTVEFLANMQRMVAHNTNGEDDVFKAYHSLIEAAHSINTINTGIYTGIKGLNLRGGGSIHSFLMKALAEDTYMRNFRKSLDSIKDAPDEMKVHLKRQILGALEYLYDVIRKAEDDDEYMQWRYSDPVVERYGKYEDVRVIPKT